MTRHDAHVRAWKRLGGDFVLDDAAFERMLQGVLKHQVAQAAILLRRDREARRALGRLRW